MSRESVRVNWGAGRSCEIPREVAESYEGPVRSVLPRLVEEHVGDPEMLEYLNSDRVVYEGTDEGGGEAQIRPEDDWQAQVRTFEEVFVARSHQGGCEHRTTAARPVIGTRP